MNVPRWITALPLRLRSIFRRTRAEQDLDDELSFHLAMEARASGDDKADALRRARLASGQRAAGEGTMPRRVAAAVG